MDIQRGIPIQESQEATGDVESDIYPDHSQLGTAVIICNVNFETAAPRRVAKLDIDRLCVVLREIGFHVDTPHVDKTDVEMVKILQDAASADHKDSRCFMCIISSHGDWDEDGTGVSDVVCATNGVVHIKTLTNAISPRNAPTLDNKPKIFLLQHCRGNRMPANIGIVENLITNEVTGQQEKTFPGSDIMYTGCDAVRVESYNIPYELPIRRDYFLHYATVPGFVSFKKVGVGTPFLKAWCDVLSQVTTNREIHDLATTVNAKVCEDYESNAPKKGPPKGQHQRKQTPQIVSSLTKDFIFPLLTPDNYGDLSTQLDLKLKI